MVKWRWRSTAILALCCFGALASALWIDHFVFQHPEKHAAGNSDIFTMTYPHWVYIGNALENGSLPLWNPYQLAGQPFLGLHVPALLYPPNLLVQSLLDPGKALAAHAVLHLAFAGFFMWLLGGRLGLGTGARIASALAYILSGPAIHAIYVPNFFSNLVWLPAILWALHGLLSEARTRWLVTLALFASFAFLGGHVQAFVYVAQFAMAYTVFGLVFVTPRGLRARVLKHLTIAALLTLGFSGPQLLPAIEMALSAVRSFGGLSLEQAAFLSIAPGDLVSGILGRAVEPPRFQPFFTLTLPTLTVFLVASGLLVRQRWATWLFFLAGAFLAGTFMLGSVTPVFKLYHSLPLGDLFRAPRRMDFLYAFQVSVLIGIGLQALKERLNAVTVQPFFSTAVVFLCVVAIGVQGYSRIDLPLAHPAYGPFPDDAPVELIDEMKSRGELPRYFLEPGRAVWTPRISVKTGTMHEVFVLPDYEASMPHDYQMFFGVPDRPTPWHGRLSVLSDARPQPLDNMRKRLDLMSVRFYAIWTHWPPRRAAGQRLAAADLERFAGGERFPIGPVDVIERPTARPRVYAVRKVRFEFDMQSVLDRISTDTFRPEDEVVLISPTPRKAWSADGPLVPDAAAISAYGTEEVSITAQCHASCLLVLTDLFYPGWRVFVDGKEKEIHRVNGLFRGVWLDPGSHEIQYRYEPTSFRIGLALMLLAFLASGVMLFFDRPPRHRHESMSA